jgi:hypothetical protein
MNAVTDRIGSTKASRATVEALAGAMSANAQVLYDRELQLTSRSISEAERNLERYAQMIRSLHQQLGTDRAQLRHLEENPPEIDVAAAGEELKFIRSLPGVMRVIINERGEIVVSIRTACLYQGRKYDLGDFDIILPWMKIRDGETFRLVCTRSGLQSYEERREPDPYYYEPPSSCGRLDCEQCADDRRRTRARSEPRVITRYRSPLYWGSGDGNADHTGAGTFCFGSGDRYTQIYEFWRRCRFGELVHLVIATMCMVNDADWCQLPTRYCSTRLSKKRQATWRFGKPPAYLEARENANDRDGSYI